METKGRTSDRFVFRNPNYDDYAKEGKVEEQREEVKFLAEEVLEWTSRSDLRREISIDAEDSVGTPEDSDTLENFDEMLSTMLGDVNEEVNNAEGGGGIDKFIEEMLEKVEKDGSYLDRIQDSCVFGDLLEDLLRNTLREKAEKEEKELSSWITNGEPEVETGVAEEEKEYKRDIKENKNKMCPVNVKMQRSEQESTMAKGDYFEYKRSLYLIEKLREREENLMKRRVKAVRFGVEFSFLVAEYMFLIPNELLASEIEDLKRFGVNEYDKGTSVIIGKLEEVFEMVIRKKENKEDHNVNLPESVRFDDYVPLCTDAIQVLGKIVWALRSNQCERPKLSYLDSLFVDCQKLLMKTELKLAEMKQWIYRSVSADSESFSKSERFDTLLRRKLMKRVNSENRFGRSMIGYYVVEIWKSLFQAESLQEQRK